MLAREKSNKLWYNYASCSLKDFIRRVEKQAREW